MNTITPLFPLGNVVITTNALNTLTEANPEASYEMVKILGRHQSGDWGIVDNEDKSSNDDAVKNGSRILSAYEIEGIKVWVITEYDRSITTILLPEDY